MNPSDSLPLLLLALMAEAAFGYPQRFYAAIGHPVTWIGRLIGALDRRLNREDASFAGRKTMGALALAVLLAITVVLAAAVQHLLLAAGPLALIPLALIASTLIAQRSLHEHVARVAEGLEREGLEGGRRAVSMIVGRNPQTLDEAGVARAAIESLAENFSDGVVAPTFWMVLASLPMFLVLPTLLRHGVDFWFALAASCALTVGLYCLAIWLFPKLGISV